MEKIAIFGTGEQALINYYEIRKNYEVVFFLDNYTEKREFLGRNVEKPDQLNVYAYRIVVCCKYYCEIATQLKSMGLIELKDFLPFGALGKQIVLLHGNCHMGILKAYMTKSEVFLQKYWIYPLLPIQSIKAGYIDDDLLKNCDLFIHQDIRKENYYGEKLSDDYIIPRLGGRSITIPNLYSFGMVFFPQTIMNTNNREFKGDPNGLFRHADANVEEMLSQGVKRIDDILNVIKGNVYSEEFLKTEFENQKQKIIEREKRWDVKIIDYILQNFQEKRLFYDYGHPTNIVIKEICVRLFRLLNLDETSIKEINLNLGMQEEPVYPCVQKALKMNWNNNNLREDGYKLIRGNMDFDEYYKEYLYWCHEIR